MLKITILEFSQTSLLAFIRNNMRFKRLKDNSSPDEIEYMRKLASFMNDFMNVRDIILDDYIKSDIFVEYFTITQYNEYVAEINKFIRNFVESNN